MQVLDSLDISAIRELLLASGPVASVYFRPGGAADVDAGLRWQVLADRLTASGADSTTVELLAKPMLGSVPAPGVLAAFAASGEVKLTVGLPDSRQPDLARYSQLPHLVPLLAWWQQHPAHVVAVVDRTGADIEAYPRGATRPITATVTGPDDEIERNAPGGWSQLRYQHRAEDSWLHNATRVAHVVARTLQRHDAQLLLVAGDVRAVQYLGQQLPAWVRRDVPIQQVSGSRSPDGALPERMQQVAELVRHAADEQTTALLAQLADEQHPGGRGVQGARATLDALAHGRVATLLIGDDPDQRRTAWFGPDATDLADRREPLLRAGKHAQRGRLVDVAVRAALLTSAEIRVLPAGIAAAPAEGIGALCRFARPEEPRPNGAPGEQQPSEGAS